MSPRLQLIWANAAYLFSGKLLISRAHLTGRPHLVPSDFASIAVATNEDIATDTYLIEKLNLLGIRRVRLDLTYGDLDNHVVRFFKALRIAGVKVDLHLVQPFHAAQNMLDSATQELWRAFVVRVCDELARDAEQIEVGSTINRKRWAGYDLERFLITWEVAYKEIKTRNLTITGPNITDFEPLYNIGILALLKRRQLLPDIHSDNLFSERSIEPERFDHKILGHRFAWLGRFNLLKKATWLQKIGADFKVPRLQSPAAFWTLPRISRTLTDTEQKQADYLARYMVLCAVSGKLESVGWGPLVCSREGLIDDCMPYPKLERITHYQSIGNISNMRVRIGFEAYRTFIANIPGMEYQRSLQTDLLQIHVFSNGEQETHVAWTRNSRAVALQSIYMTEDLAHSRFETRDGQVLANIPHLISESPLYIHFANNQSIGLKANKHALSGTIIHAHRPDTNYYIYEKDGWRGIIAAKCEQDYERLLAAIAPSLLVIDNASILRKARNAIWTITNPLNETQKLVVKQPVRVRWYRKLIDKNRPSKALRSWNGANELLRRGISNAMPVAYFEQVGDTTLTQNFFICEEIKADFSAREIFSAIATGATEYQGISASSAYQQIGDFIFNLHRYGVFFRDLSGGNILIKILPDGKLQCSLIDTARAHFREGSTVMPQRLSDLARACNKLHSAGRNALMNYYMGKLGKRFGYWQKLPFLIYNVKVVIKRQTKAKNVLRLLGLKKR